MDEANDQSSYCFNGSHGLRLCRLIHLRLLGSAAGGGLPQWNCSCPNCQDVRLHRRLPQTQSSLAVSGNDQDWFIVNASPDIGQQMLAFSSLHPTASDLRHSLIQGVLLTNADLDHVLGLFLLREGEGLQVHATEAIQESLETGLHLDSTLKSFSGITWHQPPFQAFIPLLNRSGKPSGLQYRAIPLPGTPPPFARAKEIQGVHSVAYLIRDDREDKVLLVAPDVAALVPELENIFPTAQAIFWDGTFWSDEELIKIKPSARRAREIGHLPIYPEMLERLSNLSAPDRIFMHINNTNPILNPHSSERRLVEEAGWQVGYDGLELKW